MLWHGKNFKGFINLAKQMLFDNTGTDLVSTNAEDAIKEVDDKFENYTITQTDHFTAISLSGANQSGTYTCPCDCMIMMNIFSNTSTDSGGGVRINDVEALRLASRAGLINIVTTARCKKGDIVTASTPSAGGQTYVYVYYPNATQS